MSMIKRMMQKNLISSEQQEHDILENGKVSNESEKKEKSYVDNENAVDDEADLMADGNIEEDASSLSKNFYLNIKLLILINDLVDSGNTPKKVAFKKLDNEQQKEKAEKIDSPSSPQLQPSYSRQTSQTIINKSAHNSYSNSTGPDNQTLLRLLEEGEQLHSMFRCARIQGLDTLEGLLLFGKDFYYVVDGFTLLKTREIRDLDFLPEQFVLFFLLLFIKTIKTNFIFFTLIIFNFLDIMILLCLIWQWAAQIAHLLVLIDNAVNLVMTILKKCINAVICYNRLH